MSVIRSRVMGLLQKAWDFIDYCLNRGRMLLGLRRERRRFGRAIRGPVNTILVVRLGSIGDVVRAMGVVSALKQRYPAAAIDFLTAASTRDLIAHHPALRAVYDLRDLKRLVAYDWVINLQNPEPLASFLLPEMSYSDVLSHLSHGIESKHVSGRRLEGGREVTSTNVLYCLSELEEVFLIAYLDFTPDVYPEVTIPIDSGQADAGEKFRLPAGPLLGLFLGSNSIGRGADEGFRTYSIDYLERLIAHFSSRFSIVVIGQSSARNEAELSRYRAVASSYNVVDLVDKTTLQELLSVLDRLDVLVSCDSSPIHLANARGVPVVGLYCLDATFKMGPKLEYENLTALNSATPCFHYTWRWKYFCESCRDPRTRAAYCHHDTWAFGVDRIPVERVDDAVRRLLAGARRSEVQTS